MGSTMPAAQLSKVGLADAATLLSAGTKGVSSGHSRGESARSALRAPYPCVNKAHFETFIFYNSDLYSTFAYFGGRGLVGVEIDKTCEGIG